MKRILTAALIALVCIPSLVFGSDFTKHYLDKHPVAKRGKPVGVYYGGDAWIFYSKSQGYGIDYMKVTADFKKETGQVSEMDGCSPGCCCLFNKTLYLFGVNAGDRTIEYSHPIGGETWAPKKRITINGQHIKMGKTETSAMGAMAAAELNGTLYLFYVSDDLGTIKYIKTSDGANWIAPSGAEVDFCSGNVSVCNYQTPNGEQRLMIANPDDDFSLSAASFDGDAITKRWEIRTDKGKWIGACWVTLIAGSAPSYSSTPGHLEVQLFYSGKSKHYPLKRAIFDVNTGTWHVNDKTIDLLYHSGSWPCALSNFKTEGANIRKEVWCFYPYAYATDRDLTLPCVLSYTSDLLVVDRDSTISQEMDTTYRKLWSLLGVLQGPPPYHLNGVEFGSPPTTFTFGTEEEKGTEITHEYEMSFFSHAGLEKSGVGVSVEYEHAMATKHTWDSIFTKGVEYTVSPDPAYNWGYRIFLKPTITRDKIELLDYRGAPVGIHDYFFYITGGNIQIEPYEMDSVNTHDITSFENRYPDPQDTVCSGEVTWLPTLQSKVTFGTKTEYKTTNTTKNTLKVEGGLKKGIFDIGAGGEGSITFEGTHSSSINKKLSFEVDGLACGDPRPGYPEDVKSYNLRGYWIQAREGVDYYWIPDDYKDCRPWLFTWNVTNIQYQEGSAEDVEEEELAACLNLDVTGFSSGVTISYSLPRTERISLKVYDVNGRLVKALVSGEEATGDHSINWDGSDDRGRALSSGVYFARLEAGTEQRLAKIVLLR